MHGSTEKDLKYKKLTFYTTHHVFSGQFSGRVDI